jgi:type I restriction enzyme R subunit
LKRLGSGRAKADAIMTRMSKRIDAKWDENPTFYKKFSERIEETLAQYKEKRISEADYLERMTDILQDFRRGYSGVEYPESIRNYPHAQAFYGVVCEEAAEYCVDSSKTDILAMLAMDIDIIIDKHSKVDWHDNLEVHNKIAQEIDDLIYLYQKKHDLRLPYDQVDKIIENVKTVALRRY